LNSLIGEARMLAYNYRPGDTGVITSFTGKYFVGEKKQKLEEAIKISPDAAEQCLREIY
jgi:hypothetical protein